MFGFNKNKKESEDLLDLLMRVTDQILERGYITEDSIAFVKMTIDALKMRAQYEMDLIATRIRVKLPKYVVSVMSHNKSV